MDSSLSDEDFEEGQTEVKRARNESRNFNLRRSFDKPTRLRKTRFASRDSNSYHPKGKLKS